MTLAEHRVAQQRKTARRTAAALFGLSMFIGGLFVYSYPRLRMERALNFVCMQVPGLVEGRCWYHGFLIPETL